MGTPRRLPWVAILAWLSCVLGAEKDKGGGQTPEPELAPGKETRIENEKAGEGHLIVYVPTDYKPDRRWPVIFCYHGQGGQPTVWPFRDVAGGKGFIIVGLGYCDACSSE